MNFIFNIYLLCFFITMGYSWDLQNFGISHDYFVSSIAIHRSRAFLALPRSVCHNNISNPTVVEVPWPVNFKPTTYRKPRDKFLELQKWGDCKSIQDAVSLDIEPRKPKLWILDRGNEFCEAKIVSYNVFYNSFSDIKELQDVPKNNLNCITIDPTQGVDGYKMYIGNAGENKLLVFSLRSLKWWNINLREMNKMTVRINADFLAISKTDPVLYVSGRNSLDLFSISLDYIRSFQDEISHQIKHKTERSVNVNVTLIGQKMGISTGLETDFKGGLSYYMVRDFVVVRWLTGFPMTAEHHTVLVQSYEELPYVSELFSDPQFGLWALINPLPLDKCYEGNNTLRPNIPKLEGRVVRVLKYNTFLNDIFYL